MSYTSSEDGANVPNQFRMCNTSSYLRYFRPWKLAVPALFLTTVILIHVCRSWVVSKRPSSTLPKQVWTVCNFTGRAEAVKQTYRAAYGEYLKHAFPSDELKPLKNKSVDNFNGWGVTAIDSIDTMILMGLTDEYEQVRRHVANTDFTRPIDIDRDALIFFFETIIRYLGGMLSAYHLSNDAVFLTAADDLAKTLLPAFDTPSGLPATIVKFRRGKGVPSEAYLGSRVYLAEIGTCQLEYKYLARLTRRIAYFTKADDVTRHLHKYQVQDIGEGRKYAGLWPVLWDSKTGEPANQHYTMGASADSTYEYLLKGYLLSGKTETYLLNMYMEAMRAALRNLVYLSPTRNLMYVTDVIKDKPVGNMQHLSCYFPALLALVNHLLPDTVYSSTIEKETFALAAEGLAETCYILYEDQISGLGPEEVKFYSTVSGDDDAIHKAGTWMELMEKWIEEGKNLDRKDVPGSHRFNPLKSLRTETSRAKEYSVKDSGWYLRPEAVEAMYLMWRTTGETIWRERAWEMYLSMEKYAKLPSGAYATVPNVDTEIHAPADYQQSYFFAETLKYLSLTFLEEDPWPLDKFVFTTEAHPLPVFTWTDSDKSWFRIS